MFNKNFILLTFVTLIISFSFIACGPDDDDDDDINGTLNLKFEHFVDDAEMEADTMLYTNPAGNNFEVSEVQWFISDVTLNKSNGDQVLLNAWTFYHYIDTDIPSTLNWLLEDKIEPGDYSSITFTFGIKGEKNEPYMLVNYPESAMFWPYHLGGENGGYHYLKLNGFWKDPTGFRRGYQFHLGVGQEQDANGVRKKMWNTNMNPPDTSYVFVQNWFDVTLDNSAITIKDNTVTSVTVRMNIEEWFTNPNNYDFNYFGGETMENQEALQAIKENGLNVFTVSKIE